jgi:hypothetical protein
MHPNQRPCTPLMQRGTDCIKQDCDDLNIFSGSVRWIHVIPEVSILWDGVVSENMDLGMRLS